MVSVSVGSILSIFILVRNVEIVFSKFKKKLVFSNGKKNHNYRRTIVIFV